MAMINLHSANVIGNKWNCLYPNPVEVDDEKSLMAAVAHDYVCAQYRDNYRSKKNFIVSNCLPVDCDNEHSENPEDWITPNDVARAFPNVTFFVHYSRHHNRVKDGKPARPRFHINWDIMRKFAMAEKIANNSQAVFTGIGGWLGYFLGGRRQGQTGKLQLCHRG